MLIVSNYHYIREDFNSEVPSIFGLTPYQFRLQLEQLAKQGDFISQEELIKFRKKKLNKNYILITFDDGLKEQYELAKPILDAMGIPFIVFINTSNFEEKTVSLVHKIHLIRSRITSTELLAELSIGNKKMLNTREKELAIKHYNYDSPETALLKYLLNFKLSVREQQDFIGPMFKEIFDEKRIAKDLYLEEEMLHSLYREGNLGSHSHHHLPLGILKKEDVEKELEKTQDFFIRKFSKRAAAISYPYGSAEACLRIKDELEKAQFKLGFTMERAVNCSLQKDSLLLSRFDCNDLLTGKNDLFKNKGLFEKPYFRTWQK